MRLKIAKFVPGLMLLFMVALASAGCNGETDPDLGTEIENTVDYYRQNKVELKSWWNLIALRSAGENLHSENWKHPKWDSSKLDKEAPATDYAGFILGMLAKNESPEKAWEDRNLTRELKQLQQPDGSFGDTINNTIWAMIALDAASGNYNESKALEYLLGLQRNDGGFSLEGQTGDPDVTGMALVALSQHQDKPQVEEAIEHAVKYLDDAQLDTAGFSSMETDNLNSLSTVISGLIAVGEDPLSEDWRKNNTTVLDALLRFQLDNNSFSFTLEGSSNSMATHQALIALGDLETGKTIWQNLE